MPDCGFAFRRPQRRVGGAGLLRGENRTENVDVVVEVKTLFGDLRKGAEAEYPGVVDQNIQSSELGIHFIE